MPKVKHRHSRTRGRLRRTFYKATAPNSSKCPQCGKLKKPHNICPYCGYYNKTQIKSIENLDDRKAKRDKKKGKT